MIYKKARSRVAFFYWAYSRDDKKNDRKWPISFTFNGGPTSSSSWIQFGGLAPKILDFLQDGIAPVDKNLHDNSLTTLADSDLVFLDPVNSGLSRPVPEVPIEYFNDIDMDAIGTSSGMYQYLLKFERMHSPKYLIGESYGGTRAALMARYLDEKLHLKLSGMILISPWVNGLIDVFDANSVNDFPFTTYLPAYAVTAWYYKRLAPELQKLSIEAIFKKAQTFAQTTYLLALSNQDRMGAKKREAVVMQLSALTSLSPEYIRERNLRISINDFRKDLLGVKNHSISYYDGRINRLVEDPDKEDPMDTVNPFFASAVEIGLQQLGLNAIGSYVDYYSPPRWSNKKIDKTMEGGYSHVMDDLTILLQNNPSLNIYFGSGYFDFACPLAEAPILVRHLPKKVQGQIQLHRFFGGHPFYFGELGRKQFAEEVHRYYLQTNTPILNGTP